MPTTIEGSQLAALQEEPPQAGSIAAPNAPTKTATTTPSIRRRFIAALDLRYRRDHCTATTDPLRNQVPQLRACSSSWFRSWFRPRLAATGDSVFARSESRVMH